MSKAKIAVVSTDGINVNQHFGKADRFLIYDMDDKLTWVEDRLAEPLSVDDPNHAFNADRFSRVAAVLKDCSKVFVTRIGDTPAAKLKAMGVEPVIFDGSIGEISNKI